MVFPSPLVPARFVAREKRFLVHVTLGDGQQAIAHTNNTGTMKGCLVPGGRVWLSPAANPARKLPWTLEITEVAGPRPADPPVLVGVNTALANRLVDEAWRQGQLAGLADLTDIRAEVPYGSRGSRCDFLLTSGPVDAPTARAWLEVKNVSHVRGGQALFPDAVTQRGRKHLLELAEMAGRGDRAVLIFVVQRGDADRVGPADAIDPEYGRTLRQVAAAGVELVGLRATVRPNCIRPADPLPVRL